MFPPPRPALPADTDACNVKAFTRRRLPLPADHMPRNDLQTDCRADR